MKSFFSRISKLVLISFLLSSLLHSEPEIVPTAPARGLYVPVFDTNGVKIWEITGFTGEILGNSSIAMSNMLINRCGKNNDVIFTIESGCANITPSSNFAAGDGVVVVNGKNFTAVARDWNFFGGEKRFAASRDVKVVFNENVAEFIAP
ncbi:MAG: hypothetical protein LBS87_00750 [Puniceicoccales bacterium]|nr:hypothetical protein [Puniceicoccales bacterium]